MGLIIVMVIIWIIYMILTKDKRAEMREEQRCAFEQKKQEMLTDPVIATMARSIVEVLTNLKDGPVKILRQDGRYYVLFDKGSVYFETRWTEKVGDSFEQRKNTQCILNRIDMGKNPLTNEENNIFKGIVCEKLKEIPWLDVRDSYSELTIRKAKNATIPEAF